MIMSKLRIILYTQSRIKVIVTCSPSIHYQYSKSKVIRNIQLRLLAISLPLKH